MIIMIPNFQNYNNKNSGSVKIPIIIGGVIIIFIVLAVVLLRANSVPAPKQDLQELNSQFVDLLKEKTPSWDAFPATKLWWEAKAAKHLGDFNLSKQKLTEAIELIGPVKRVGYDEILKYVGAQKHPLPKGKLQPPENGAYTGVWQFPILCSPDECPKAVSTRQPSRMPRWCFLLPLGIHWRRLIIMILTC